MELKDPIRTRRLALRTLTLDDATPRYLSWLCDPAVMTYLEARLENHSLDSVRAFIQTVNATPDNLLLGIFSNGGAHIGNIKLGPISDYHRHGPVGILIGDRECWGQGYASEAISALTRYAFTVLELDKLHAGCYASNIGSRKAFARAGYIEEGRQKSYWRSGETREDQIHLGLTRADWNANNT